MVPDVLARAVPDARFRLQVRAAAAVVGLLGLPLFVGAVASEVQPAILFGLPLFLGSAVAAGSFGRGNLAEVRLTTAGLDLIGNDGEVRHVPAQGVGALAVTGTVLSGRLASLPGTWWASSYGRLVVLDHAHDVICARRAGWMRVDDLAALAATVQLPWLGRGHRAVPVVVGPLPPEMAVGGIPTEGDPASAAAAARTRRPVARVGWTILGLVAAIAAGSFLLEAIPRSAAGVRIAVGWVIGLSVLALLFVVPVLLLRTSPHRRARRILTDGGVWVPVDVTVVVGMVADTSARVVGVTDPSTGVQEWWTVETGGQHGWLQGDDRTWLWMLHGRGRHALLAPPSRALVAVIERRRLNAGVQKQASRTVAPFQDERRQREAWHAWASAQSPHGYPHAAGSMVEPVPSPPTAPVVDQPPPPAPPHPGAL